MYKYFVSYCYVDGSFSGFDNAILTPPEKLDNITSLQKMEDLIKKAHKHSTVKILYFKEII